MPKDMHVLRFLLNEPKTRYEIAAHFGNHYNTTRTYVDRLLELEFIFVASTRPWHTGEVKYYLITPKGRSMLRGYEEAVRREV